MFRHERGMVGMAAERKATRQRPASARSRRTATAQQRRSRTPAARRGNGGATVKVPVVAPTVKVMKVHVPGRGMSYIGDAGRLAASYLPPADRLAFYGGLGLAAIVGVLDWPVAAAVGLGTMIARRAFRRDTARPSGLRAAATARTEGGTVTERMAEPEAAAAGGRTRARTTSRRSTTRAGGTSRTAAAGRSRSTSRSSTASRSTGASASRSRSTTSRSGGTASRSGGTTSRSGGTTSGSRGTASRSRTETSPSRRAATRATSSGASGTTARGTRTAGSATARRT